MTDTTISKKDQRQRKEIKNKETESTAKNEGVLNGMGKQKNST